MKDLQTLIGHPSVQGFQKLMLVTGRPITLMRAGEQKVMGNPLNNGQLHNLLKASLPADVMAGFQWGKELAANLDGHAVRIVLKPEKSIIVEIAPATASPAPAATPAPVAPSTAALDEPDDSEAVAEEVERLTDAENTALVYCPGNSPGDLADRIDALGFPLRQTASVHATLEVLKYHDYPLFVMVLGSDYADDPVFRYLANLNMDLRRKQYAALVAPGLASGDSLLAFTLSVNLVVDANDASSFTSLAEKGITEWKRFVAPLHDFLKEAGRL